MRCDPSNSELYQVGKDHLYRDPPHHLSSEPLA
jgi:hypothetical protein